MTGDKSQGRGVSGFFTRWNARSATGPGFVFGCVAFFLWPGFASFPQYLYFPFLIALGLTALCGLSILVLTAVDFRNNQRGRRIRPIRAFDIVFGLMLTGPAALELMTLLR